MSKLVFKMNLLNTLHTLFLFGSLYLILYLLLGIIFSELAIYLSILFLIISIILIPKSNIQKVIKKHNGYKINFHNNKQLYSLLNKLSNEANLNKIPKLYYLPTNELNAFCVGNKNENAIAISKGLFEFLSIEELYGVMAHEISHIKNDDIWLMQYSSMILSIICFISIFISMFLLSILILFPVEFDNRIYLILFLLVGLPILSIFIHFTISRIREYKADIEAVKLTKNASYLLNALRKLKSIDNRYKFYQQFLKKDSFSIYKSFFNTHPPLNKRIEKLKELYFSSNLYTDVFRRFNTNRNIFFYYR